jgi:outer membrane protein OmpA-like peptidoglycan-associated protein
MTTLYSAKARALKFNAAMAVAAALTLTACASGPRENPEIVRLETLLRSSYNDQFIAEYGRAELQNAEQHLGMARVAWRKDRDPELAHHLGMTNGLLELAAVRGGQGRTKAEITNLRARQDELRVAARDRELRNAQGQAAAATQAAQNAEMAAAAARQEAAAANQQLAALQTQLKEFEFQITSLGGSMTLRDVMFEVDSAQLRPGAEQRLQPLVNYLTAMPNTTIRIEGHTDSTGGEEYNNRLSRERAESVARALQQQGIAANRIQTAGFGYSKPIASNSTVSGREQNRRVEIIMMNN